MNNRFTLVGVLLSVIVLAGCASTGVQTIQDARARQTNTRVVLHEDDAPPRIATVYLASSTRDVRMRSQHRAIMRTVLRDALDNVGFRVIVPRTDRGRGPLRRDTVPAAADFELRLSAPTAVERGWRHVLVRTRYARVIMALEMYDTRDDALAGTGYGEHTNYMTSYNWGSRGDAIYEAAMVAASKSVDDLLASLEAKGRATVIRPQQ